MALSEEWVDKINEKLASIFKDEPKILADILWSLTNDNIDSNWKTLKSLFNLGNAFKAYALRIAEDSVELKKMAQEKASKAFEKLAEEMKKELAVEKYQQREVKSKELDAEDYSNYVTTFKAAISYMDDVVDLFAKNGNILMVGLASVFLTVEAIINIRKYWKGEITGVRCCKIIIDSSFTVVSGIAGSAGGAAVGAIVGGPVGAIVGGIIGGVITAKVASLLSDYLTRYIFGIPKDIALEHAYSYFGVKMSVSNSEMNTAYRRMCLKHHPDKGGKKEDFFIVQAHMAIIKLARGYDDL